MLLARLVRASTEVGATRSRKAKIAALAAALAEALAAREQWPAYGARARALVEREFDWDALAGRYLALYRRLRD